VIGPTPTAQLCAAERSHPATERLDVVQYGLAFCHNVLGLEGNLLRFVRRVGKVGLVRAGYRTRAGRRLTVVVLGIVADEAALFGNSLPAHAVTAVDGKHVRVVRGC
jgi:hypothetical protein